MKAVVFDLGNVLIRYDHSETLSSLAAVSRLSAGEIDQLMAKVAHAAGIGEMSIVDLHLYLVEQAGMTADFERFLAAFCAGQERLEEPVAYAVALQERTDVTVAVISNTNEGHVLWLDRHVPELKLFDLVMMSNEVGLTKPDPAIYELALELLDLEPARAIFIDDLAANVDAARSVGMAGIVNDDWQRTMAATDSWLMAATATA